MPELQTSAFSSYLTRLRTSGAAKKGVPTLLIIPSCFSRASPVSKLGVVAVVDKHVGGLQITMDHGRVLCVQVSHRPRNANGNG